MDEERFARLRFLSFEWGAKKTDSPDLTKWRSKLKLEQIELLYIIGVADGSPYFLFRDWLAENRERKVVFLEKEGSLIGHLFEMNHPLLADPQIDLEWFASEETLTELAEKHPAKRLEVVCLPGVKKEKIRLKLLRKTTLSHALYQDRLYGYQHFENFVRNIPHLKNSFYANSFQNLFSGKTAIICGAGPSLEQAIPLLKKLGNRALIIAGGSAVGALWSKGITPHFAMAIDPNHEELTRFQNLESCQCPLLVSTRVHHGVISLWKGPLGYMRAGIGGAPELGLEEELKLIDPLLGEHLGEETISVTPICLAFAQLLGCSTICLAGVDLAYTNGERYAKGVDAISTRLEEVEAQKNGADRILRRKDKKGNLVQTAVRWVMEGAGISRYAKKHPEIRWINTTEGGLPIRGFEEISLAQAVEKYCRDTFDFRSKIKEQIAARPLPDPTDKLEELKLSLERLIEHLEVLTGEKKGSKALAEFELKEELAASILFYDIHTLLVRQEEANRWSFYLSHARKYLSRF